MKTAIGTRNVSFKALTKTTGTLQFLLEIIQSDFEWNQVEGSNGTTKLKVILLYGLCSDTRAKASDANLASTL